MPLKEYDYAVIGSGPAGHVSAIKASQSGLRTVVIEKDHDMFGGVCLNEGCIPAKSLYHSARILDIVKNTPELCGADIGELRMDVRKMVEKSRTAAEHLKQGLSFLFKKNGIDIIEGSARFADNKTLTVTGRDGETTITAKNLLVAAGSYPRRLDALPFNRNTIMDSSDAIRIGDVPASICIVGAGAIGMEYAAFINTLGSEVTIVEAQPQVLPSEDAETARRLHSLMKKRGIKIFTSTVVKNAVPRDSGLMLELESSDGKSTLNVRKVLVATGRVPATATLGLENTDVSVTEKGFLRTEPSMRTDAHCILAAGDVVSTPLLAHVAYAEGILAAETAAGMKGTPIDYTSVPNVIYTDIQLASIGLTEEKARETGLEIAVGKQFFKANGRAVVNSEDEGFIKVIADKKTRKIIGAHILGYDAAELIHEFAVAKKNGLTVDDILSTIHAHPTFSESAVDACESVFGKAIHS